MRLVFVLLVLLDLMIPSCFPLMHRADLPNDEDARCLDGSRYAYGFRQGHGRGSDLWILHLQGGAWCATEEECAARRDSPLGRNGSPWSTLQEPLGSMSDDAETNPDLYDWNAVHSPQNGPARQVEAAAFWRSCLAGPSPSRCALSLAPEPRFGCRTATVHPS